MLPSPSLTAFVRVLAFATLTATATATDVTTVIYSAPTTTAQVATTVTTIVHVTTTTTTRAPTTPPPGPSSTPPWSIGTSTPRTTRSAGTAPVTLQCAGSGAYAGCMYGAGRSRDCCERDSAKTPAECAAVYTVNTANCETASRVTITCSSPGDMEACCDELYGAWFGGGGGGGDEC
ncbi:hypothetical protein JCM10450v2_003920 [Rhodotorula kratochvilovae]